MRTDSVTRLEVLDYELNEVTSFEIIHGYYYQFFTIRDGKLWVIDLPSQIKYPYLHHLSAFPRYRCKE